MTSPRDRLLCRAREKSMRCKKYKIKIKNVRKWKPPLVLNSPGVKQVAYKTHWSLYHGSVRYILQ